MEIDKRAAKLLKLLKRQAPMWKQSPQQVRAILRTNKNPFAPPAPELNYTFDHVVVTGDAQLLLREYSSVEADAVSPCILFFHGGGFVIGSVDEYDTIAAQLAHMTGARVFSLEYRLAPEVKYPTMHHDAYAAYEWLLEHRFRLHLTKVAVCGDSAGGNLAASLCLYARDHGIESPALQMLWYPMTHGDKEFPSRVEFADDYYITAADMRWFAEQFLESPEQISDKYFAPGLAADLGALPTALLLTAGFDVLHDEGESYARQLEQAAVRVEYECYADMFHGFISFGGGLQQGMAAIAHTASFFRHHIK